MEALGAFSGIIILFILIAAILAFFMPFFIFRIRNELIDLNKKTGATNEKLSEIITLLEIQFKESPKITNPTIEVKEIKCYICQEKFPSTQIKQINRKPICFLCREKNNL